MAADGNISAWPTWSASTFWRMWRRIFREGVTPGGFSAVLEEIVKRGWLGDKAGQGFYKKARGADGKDERLVLDLDTFEYRPTAKAALPALEMAKNAATVEERLQACCWPKRSRRRTRRRSFFGRFFRRCGTLRRNGLGRRPTTRLRSIRRCERGSTGSWGRLRCGMRRGEGNRRNG